MAQGHIQRSFEGLELNEKCMLLLDQISEGTDSARILM
jgi:hypothetical protein